MLSFFWNDNFWKFILELDKMKWSERHLSQVVDIFLSTSFV